MLLGDLRVLLLLALVVCGVFALASPEIELLGVTTTYGNQTLEKTTATSVCACTWASRVARTAASMRRCTRSATP